MLGDEVIALSKNGIDTKSTAASIKVVEIKIESN